MLETSMRTDYNARFFLPFIHTEGKCLRFSYAFFGDGVATLRVVASDPELISTALVELETETGKPGRWRTYFSVLPSGQNRIIFEGVRGIGTSGLGLDDIELTDCQSFEGKYA